MSVNNANRTLRRRRAAAAIALCQLAAILILWGLATPFGAGALMGWLQPYPALAPAGLAQLAAGPPAAIVILSAGQRVYAPEFGGPTADDLTLERVRYGAFLARRSGLPVLVSGGRFRPEDVALADVMAKVLADDYGVKARWVETQSRNTAENAIFSAAMLRRDGVQRVVLVTHAWHMPRARASFVANGVAVTAAPTSFYVTTKSLAQLWPGTRALRMSALALHELVGRQWYALRYRY